MAKLKKNGNWKKWGVVFGIFVAAVVAIGNYYVQGAMVQRHDTSIGTLKKTQGQLESNVGINKVKIKANEEKVGNVDERQRTITNELSGIRTEQENQAGYSKEMRDEQRTIQGDIRKILERLPPR